MPRIPTRTSEARYPVAFISPERATVQEREGVRAGERIIDLGGFLLEREQRAVRAERSLRIENQMNKDTLALAESFHGKTDYENFVGYAETATADLGQKYTEMASDDRFLGIAVGRLWNRKKAQVMLMVQQLKRQRLVERALGEDQTAERHSLDEYSNALTSQHRDEITAAYTIRKMELANSGVMTMEQAGTDIEDFINDAELLRADKMIYQNPTLAAELIPTGEFNLAPDDRQTRVEWAEAARVREEAKQEKLARETIKNNDLEMWQRYYAKTLTEADLEDMASNRMISEGAYKAIKEKWKNPGAEENNPIVVGDIAEQVGLHNFDGAMSMLEDAHKSGQIKTETYILKKAAIATKSYADGIGYINKAMQPSELDFDFYRKQKHADAVVDYTVRVAGGEDPMEAAKDIVRLNASSAAVNYTRYRNPRYLTGEKDSLTALDMAEAKTVDSFKKGRILLDEYRIEMDLIRAIKDALSERIRADGAVNDIDQEIKRRNVGK